MFLRRLAPLSLGVLIAILTRPLAGQSPGTIADSYRRARTLLDQSIEAHGGLASLQAAGTFRARMEGTDHWRNQSRRVEPPYDPEPWTGDLWVDVGKSRMVWTNTSRFPGGFQNANRFVIDGARGYVATLRQGTHSSAPNRTLDSQRAILFRLPHLVLLAARDQAASLRWLGPVTLQGGTRVEAITMAGAPGQATLGFDPATHQLRALLGVTADALVGDAATETEFSEYRRIGGILVPGRRVARLAGEITQDVRYPEVTFGGTAPDSLLVPPAGSVEVPAPAAVAQVRELAPGVRALSLAGSWSLAVTFTDHVLVVEPVGNGSPETIAKIKELEPGKPIRYIVPTHHHDDHSGGIRHFVAEGSTIVTTPGNRAYFTRMAAARSTLRPERQVQALPAKIETIEGKRRTLTDGVRTVELYDIGPSPHANEMVVVWLPREGVLFQGDLLNTGSGAIYPSTANATTEHFAEWLGRQGFDVKVLAGVHMAPGTKADLDTAMAKRAASTGGSDR